MPLGYITVYQPGSSKSKCSNGKGGQVYLFVIISQPTNKLIDLIVAYIYINNNNTMIYAIYYRIVRNL